MQLGQNTEKVGEDALYYEKKQQNIDTLRVQCCKCILAHRKVLLSDSACFSASCISLMLPASDPALEMKLGISELSPMPTARLSLRSSAHLSTFSSYSCRSRFESAAVSCRWHSCHAGTCGTGHTAELLEQVIRQLLSSTQERGRKMTPTELGDHQTLNVLAAFKNCAVMPSVLVSMPCSLSSSSIKTPWDCPLPRFSLDVVDFPPPIRPITRVHFFVAAIPRLPYISGFGRTVFWERLTDFPKLPAAAFSLSNRALTLFARSALFTGFDSISRRAVVFCAVHMGNQSGQPRHQVMQRERTMHKL